jgi:hypothetical protein
MERPTLAGLAAEPHWPRDRLASLTGRCRGAVVGKWAEGCRLRWGDTAPDLLRGDLGVDMARLPDVPPQREWLPAELWLRLTDAIVARFLHGDALALEPLMVADARRSAGMTARLFARQLGVPRILGATGRIHGWLYDVGEAGAVVGPGEATIRWSGAELFAQPTWRLLQIFGLRGAIETAGGRSADVVVASASHDGFEVIARWR